MNSIKKVLVIGAHGQIGQILSKKLADSERYEPTAFIRKESQKSTFDKMNVGCLVGDLEDKVSNLSNQFSGFDCIIFAAGSGGSTGPEKTLAIDLDGAVRCMEAAEASGAKRFIMVSASHSDDREFWDDAEMKPYYIAKHYADEMLRHSELDYTILRPVQLTNDSGTSKIMASLRAGDVNKEITREDVAEVILKVIDMESSIGKSIELSSGSDSIENALQSILESSAVNA